MNDVEDDNLFGGLIKILPFLLIFMFVPNLISIVTNLSTGNASNIISGNLSHIFYTSYITKCDYEPVKFCNVTNEGCKATIITEGPYWRTENVTKYEKQVCITVPED